MRQSSLPELFRKASTEPLITRKQGGRFSLHLNPPVSERFIPSRAGFAPGDQNYATLTCSRFRSASTASVHPKQSILKDQSHRKVDSARQKIQVGFKEEVDFWTVTPIKQKLIRTVLNSSNFPYQTNRKMNNMTVDLQESQSLKNKVDFNIKQAKILSGTLQQIRSNTHQIRVQYTQFINHLKDDLDNFDEEFTQLINRCYQKLSKSRRITSNELKANISQIDKVDNDLDICSNFTRDLYNKTSQLYKECLQQPIQRDTPSRGISPELDLQISSIPKTSRGATGDRRSRIKIIDLLQKNESPRKSGEQNSFLNQQEDGKMRINGKQVILSNFQDCLN